MKLAITHKYAKYAKRILNPKKRLIKLKNKDMSRITEDQVKEALDLINAYRIQLSEELYYPEYREIDITQHLSTRAVNAIDAYFKWNGIEYNIYKFGIDDVSKIKLRGRSSIKRSRGCGKKTFTEISEFIDNKGKYFTVRNE